MESRNLCRLFLVLVSLCGCTKQPVVEQEKHSQNQEVETNGSARIINSKIGLPTEVPPENLVKVSGDSLDPERDWPGFLKLAKSNINLALRILDNYESSRRTTYLERLVGDICVEDISQLESLVKIIPDAAARNGTIQFVVGKCAKTDPQKILSFAKQTGQGPIKNYAYAAVVEKFLQSGLFKVSAEVVNEMPFSTTRSSSIAALSRSWALTDPEDFLVWVNTLSMQEDRRTAIAESIPAIQSKMGVEKLVEIANASSDIAIKSACVQGIASSFPSDTQPTSVSRWLDQLSPDLRAQAISTLLQHNGANNPQDWANVVLTIKNQGQRRSLINNFVSELTRQDPQIATTLLQNLSAEKDSAAEAIVNEWYEIDSVAMSQWVNTLEQGNVKNAAYAAMARKLVDSGDIDSARDVANAIHDDKMRFKLIKSLGLK